MKAIKAKCPGCAKFHMVSIEWSGNGTPRIFCKACEWVKNSKADRYKTYTVKQPTTQLGLTRSRGMTREQKREYDRRLELAGWQFRKTIKQSMVMV